MPSEAKPQPLVVAFAGCLALLLLAYRDTWLSLAHLWSTNLTFSFGYLVVPISIWLIWERRDCLRAARPQPSGAGLVALLGAGASWFVASGVGVLGLAQLGAVAMIPALVLAVFGVGVVRCIAFPLAYLAFAVPAGDSLVPTLMDFTADMASAALRISGVPILRDELTIDIPAGRFLVARQCSGLNYVVAGLAFGALYTYLTFRSWKKRAISMLAFAVIPILANGLRVYLTILVAHLTEMRFGPGEEHVWGGRVLFLALMVVICWFGARWRDEPHPVVPTAPATGGRGTRSLGLSLSLVGASILATVMLPTFLETIRSEARARATSASGDGLLPRAASGWQGPRSHAQLWRPEISGYLSSGSGEYVHGTGSPVEVFVADFVLAAPGGSEMISYGNRLSADEPMDWISHRDVKARLAGGETLDFTSAKLRGPAGSRLVWYGYVIGGRMTRNAFLGKFREATTFVLDPFSTERIVVISTRDDEAAPERLQEYVAAHAACLVGHGSGAGCT